MTETISTDLSNTDTFINPFLRIREENNLTQEELKDALGLSSVQVIRRIEQGLYAHPTPRITQYLSSISGMGYSEILNQYADWQRQIRRNNKDVIEEGLKNYVENPRGFTVGDVFYAIKSDSHMAVCKLLALNPAQTNPVARRRNLPEFITDALDDAGINDTLIERVNQIMAFGRRM